MVDSVPLLAGKYELLRKLGTGGMAEVFLAKQRGHSGFEKLVVIKRILPSHASDRDFVEMFLDEARTAADLRHANIVQIFEVGEAAPMVAVEPSDPFGVPEGTGLFMAMEFLHGKDLRQIQRKLAARDEQMPVGHVAQIIIDAARGLHYAHEKRALDGTALNIVHRDVSPQNLIVTFEGNTKVLDFGIAKAASQDQQTASGVIKGKYTYMSPEQAEGIVVDARTDQFALGILLWELLTMRRLFKRDTEMATLRAISNDEVPPPSTFNDEVDEVLDEIVLTCLQRDPQDRYDTCEYLALDLEDCMAEEGVVHSAARLGQWMAEVFEGEIEPESSLHESLIPTPRGAGAATRTTLTAATEPARQTKAKGPVEHSAAIAQLERQPSDRRTLTLALIAFALVALVAGVFVARSLSTDDAVSKRGSAFVRTTPTGAEVFVDGVMRGKTPLKIDELTVSVPHNLRLELDGHETATASFTLAPDTAPLTLDYPLTPKQVAPVTAPVTDAGPQKQPVVVKRPVRLARLRVRVKPWGDVFIDGRFVGQTPIAAQKLKPGKHTIRVRHNDSGKSKTRSVTLKPGDDQLLRFDLR